MSIEQLGKHRPGDGRASKGIIAIDESTGTIKKRFERWACRTPRKTVAPIAKCC